jgi:hypothetical protein
MKKLAKFFLTPVGAALLLVWQLVWLMAAVAAGAYGTAALFALFACVNAALLVVVVRRQDRQLGCYVAGAAVNWPAVRRVQTALRNLGVHITHDWTEDIYTGKYNAEGALTPRILRGLAALDFAGVKAADFVVVLLPAARGSHVELGLAIALGKPVFLLSKLGDLQDAAGTGCPFYHLPNVTWCASLLDLQRELEDLA